MTQNFVFQSNKKRGILFAYALKWSWSQN